MAEAVAFDDAVELVIAWLNDQYSLRGEPSQAHSKVPNPRPTRLTRVSDGGGVRRNLALDAPRVVVDSWDLDEVSARDLHRLNRALVGALDGENVSGVGVSQVLEVGNPGQVYDPDTDLPRFQFTVELLIDGQLV